MSLSLLPRPLFDLVVALVDGDWNTRLRTLHCLDSVHRALRLDTATWYALALNACDALSKDARRIQEEYGLVSGAAGYAARDRGALQLGNEFTKDAQDIKWAVLLMLLPDDRRRIKMVTRNYANTPTVVHMCRLLDAAVADDVSLAVDTLRLCPRALHCLSFLPEKAYSPQSDIFSRSYFFNMTDSPSANEFLVGACAIHTRSSRNTLEERECHKRKKALFLYEGYNSDSVTVLTFCEFVRGMLHGSPFRVASLAPVGPLPTPTQWDRPVKLGFLLAHAGFIPTTEE